MSKKSKQVFDEARKREEEIKANQDAFGDTIAAPPARRERPKGMEVVASGAGYYDFKKEPVFEGHFVKKFLAPKDIPANKTKKGDCIGFIMVDSITGEETIISNSHTIQKALEEDGFNPNTLWWIEFIKKIEVKGKPFNQFYVAKQKS